MTAKLGKLTATLEEEKQLNISLTQNQVGATHVYFTRLLEEQFLCTSVRRVADYKFDGYKPTSTLCFW